MRKVKRTIYSETNIDRKFVMIPASNIPWIKIHGINPKNIVKIEMDVYSNTGIYKELKGWMMKYEYTYK